MIATLESKTKPVPFRSRAVYACGLVAVTLLLNLVFWGVLYWILQAGKDQYELRAKAAAENIGKAISQSLSDELDKVDLIVLFARDELNLQLAGGGIDTARLNSRLSHLKTRLPELNALRATDAEGIIRYGAGVDAASPISIAGDEPFIYLRSHPDAGAVISKPKYGQISRKWVVKIARSYRHPDGSFAGVVAGIVDVDRLISIFNRLDVGRHGFITLRDSELAFVARHPRLGDGKFIGERSVSPEFRAMIDAGESSGSFSATSPFDGMVRIISFNKVGAWPLYLSVGLSGEDYLLIWQTAAKNGVLIAIALSLLSFFAAWMIYRYRNEREHFIDTLKQSQDMFRGLAEMSSDWIWEQDRNFRFSHITGSLSEKPELTGENFLGKARWEFAADPEDPKWSMHRAILGEHRPFQDFEYDMLDANGSRHTFAVSGRPVLDPDGNFIGYHGVAKDITERKIYEERIRHMAQHDSLTLLPNRVMFYDRLAQAIRASRRNGGKFALFYLDLDRFKPINDRFGHGIGDRVLRDVAARLQSRLRESDTLARLGGDEFALITPEVANVEEIKAVAQKLIDALALPLTLADVAGPISLGVSIGIAMFPHDSENPVALVKAADDAMYRAKQEGNAYCFFTEVNA